MAELEGGFGGARRFMVSDRGEYPRECDMGASSFSVDGGDEILESGFSLDGSCDPRLGNEV